MFFFYAFLIRFCVFFFYLLSSWYVALRKDVCLSFYISIVICDLCLSCSCFLIVCWFDLLSSLVFAFRLLCITNKGVYLYDSCLFLFWFSFLNSSLVWSFFSSVCYSLGIYITNKGICLFIYMSHVYSCLFWCDLLSIILFAW